MKAVLPLAERLTTASPLIQRNHETERDQPIKLKQVQLERLGSENTPALSP